MGNYAYKHEEDKIIKEWYPKEGLPGAVLRLQLAGYKRTNGSVRQRAHLLKLKSPYCMRNIGPTLPPTISKWNPKWDAPYAKAQDLINQGVTVSNACRMAGLVRSLYYTIRKAKEGK
jgi:hypothetical protein